MEKVSGKITPFLWFESQAEEAAKFYVDLFNNAPGSRKNSVMGSVMRYDKAGAKASGRPEGTVMTVSFELEGQEFAALNGGDYFKFSGAISFVINCKTQAEVDYFWEKLSEGGEAGVCGWINRDKFGVTWQVVPAALNELLGDPDPAKSGRVMEAMLKMKKIDIVQLQRTAEQR